MRKVDADSMVLLQEDSRLGTTIRSDQKKVSHETQASHSS